MEESTNNKKDEGKTDANSNRILLGFIVVLITTPSFLALGENLDLPASLKW